MGWDGLSDRESDSAARQNISKKSPLCGLR